MRPARGRRLRRTVAVSIAGVLLVTAVLPEPARADFPTAVRAFDAGDYAGAASEWAALAANCDAQAQTALAGLFHAGLGVPQDDIKAMRWYLQAAWAGDRFAQQIVGDRYARGEVVPADSTRAAFWLTLAASRGLSWAAARRDAITATLSPDELEIVVWRLSGYPAVAAEMCGASR